MDWHRLFGLFLTDFFAGTGYEVEVEVDLSAKKQLLDVAVVRKGEVDLTRLLPDGLDGLVQYNLITFKSPTKGLLPWYLKELVSHAVNYRKQAGDSVDDMPPEEHFRLFAVTAQFPKAVNEKLNLKKIKEGVYDCVYGIDTIRVIVTSQLPLEQQNAMLHLFSASAERVKYGRANFKKHCSESSTLIDKLLASYTKEGLTMPYTMEDLEREWPTFRKELLTMLPTEELREALTPTERLQGLTPEQRLEGLTPEELRQAVPPQEWLKGLTPEQIRAMIAEYAPKQTDPEES